jgi:hypothetical protein
MNERPELPNDVLDAVHSNRKIEAIKLLRVHRNLGLKEAKHVIDAYVAENPQLIRQPPAEEGSGFGRIFFVGIVMAVIYFAYRQLS